jgi:hypothetical protein
MTASLAVAKRRVPSAFLAAVLAIGGFDPSSAVCRITPALLAWLLVPPTSKGIQGLPGWHWVWRTAETA